MKRRTLLFIILSVIVAVAPVTNWHVDANLIRGIVWRATMVATFFVGYLWNKKRKVNKKLTYNIN
jgi:hypothetical protein